MSPLPFDYRVAAVVRIVDGDTFDLILDLGLRVTLAGRFRLLGVDTPERGEPGFVEAAGYAGGWIDGAFDVGQLRARTHKADAFGRWLVDLYAHGDPDDTLSRALLDAGHAVPYTGRRSS